MTPATEPGRDALYVAAKAPLPGLVKTRLARDIGEEQAVGLYRAFLSDLAQRLAGGSPSPGWYVAPQGAWSHLEGLVARWGRPARILEQGEGSWTDRQRRLFQGAGARGERRTVLIGSDSPQLASEVIDDAFERLERDDVVLGPTHDGGYYLLGMRGWHDVLAGVAMSTDSVLEEIEARTRGMGLSLGGVAPTFDVDEACDLGALREAVARRSDMPATRGALEAMELEAG